MFGDVYYMKDWLFPEDAQDISAAVPHRAYAHTNGFALSFIGIDADYQTQHFGATVNLRFGPSTPRLLSGSPPAAGLALENLKQGFVSWRLTEGLQFDLGQFDTIYGAEVSESFANINYTRGALYYLMQPFYHTGLRTVYAPTDSVTLTALVVNGTNTFIDSDPYPDVGVQATFAPSDSTSLSLGYLLGVTENDVNDVDLSHLVDAIARFNAGDFSLVFNADLGVQTPQSGATTFFWGASLAAGYRVVDWFDVGLRGEVLQDPDAVLYGTDLLLTTGTLTLGFRPIPDSDNLLIRLDNRIEYATEPLFPSDGTLEMPGTDLHNVWGATILGVVVKTN